MIRWIKQGLVFDVTRAGVPWMHSHAQLPVADSIGGDLYRVYFGARTADQISRIGWAVVELGDRVKLLDVSTEPALSPGGIGTFDEHGVFPSCVVHVPGQRRMYYIGWNRGYRRPLFYASIGLAVSTDGGRTWSKYSEAPIMARGRHDPCLVTSPHVIRHDGKYRMTYVSGVRWSERNGELRSHYHIKYAESDDGIEWRRDGRIAIDFSTEDETNVARSWVVPARDGLHMWFGYVRGTTPYRIGYARSTDYLHWLRDDASAGIGVSAEGWDSQMICYPNVIAHRGRGYMFYNGNAFGRDGFGVAISETDLV